MSPTAVIVIIGAIIGIAMIVGALLGGFAIDAYQTSHHRRQAAEHRAFLVRTGTMPVRVTSVHQPADHDTAYTGSATVDTGGAW